MKAAKEVRFWQIIICVSAISLLIFLTFHLIASFSKLYDLQQQLTVSRTTWEGISNEKEALQAELTSLNDQIREAQLTISESQEKITELIAENEMLNEEIAKLQADP